MGFDALVIGAGPAGAAAAWALARGGRRVALVDRAAFPRDKTCGDGLIADAQAALAEMGLAGAVAARAVASPTLRIHAPGGAHVDLAGRFLCLPRARFDSLLVDAAVAAGAELLPPMEAAAPLEQDGRVCGARFARDAGAVRARVTLLATGANATVVNSFGVTAPLKPNAVAGRAYFRVPPAFAERHPHLSVVYERSLLPGYGWIFPGPDRCYNAGVGFFSDGRRALPGLHDLWRRFTTSFAPARELVAIGEPVSEFRGAPPRTGLHPSVLGRPGLLVLGDAAAMTYPATGEGIGKAMQSGLLAGRLTAEYLEGQGAGDTLHERYDAAFRAAFAGRYRAYRTAQAWTAYPRLLDLLAARANAGRFVRRELEALIAETGNPARLFSVAGIVRAVWQ